MNNRLPPATVFGSEVHTVSSSLTGLAYQLAVWLPPSYAASSQPYPVLYLLDGDLLFGAATQMITPLIWGQELPELIVVGIGYGMRSYEEWGSRRRQELTPTEAAHGSAAGGAPEFLTFLETEVIPLIDANYHTAPSGRTLYGHSLGGLFVLYTLFHQSGLFSHYCASSPSVDWDNRMVFTYLSRQQPKQLSGRVCITIGEEEQHLALVEAFVRQLKDSDQPELDLTFLRLSGESHMSSIAPAMIRGWKTLFGAAI
jgi:predicted alpha/beta superfamily hydrolase